MIPAVPPCLTAPRAVRSLAFNGAAAAAYRDKPFGAELRGVRFPLCCRFTPATGSLQTKTEAALPIIAVFVIVYPFGIKKTTS